MYKPENAPEIIRLPGGNNPASDELESTPIFDALARRSPDPVEHYIGRHRCRAESRRVRLSVVPGQAEPCDEYVPRRLPSVPTVPIGRGGRHRALRAVSRS